MINWGTTIKRYREKLNLTQGEVAKRVSITSTYLSSIEHNRKEPSFALIRALSRAFRVPQEILYWDAISFPTPIKTTHKKEIRLAKSLVDTVYRQLIPDVSHQQRPV
jgi:transcriptional regulator with XRE-family HTH domain